jgi:hypothetical protein
MRTHTSFPKNFNCFSQLPQLAVPIVRAACSRTLNFTEQLFGCRIQSYANPVHTCLRESSNVVAVQGLARNRNWNSGMLFYRFDEGNKVRENVWIVQGLDANAPHFPVFSRVFNASKDAFG